MFLLAVIITCVACIFAVVLGKTARAWWMLAKIPSPPAASWLFGHISFMTSERAPYLAHEYAKALGPIYRLRLAHMNMVVVTDHREEARLCNRGDDYLDKAPAMYTPFDYLQIPPIPDLVSHPTHDLWKAIRKAVSPCFSPSNLRAAFPMLLEFSNHVAKQLAAAGPSHPFNFNDVAKRMTLEVISSWGFGVPYDGIDLHQPHPLVVLIDEVVGVMHTVLSDPLWKVKRLWSKRVQRGVDKLVQFTAWSKGYTQSIIDRKDTISPDCIGAALLRVQDPFRGAALTFEQRSAEVAILFGAGYETTASAFTCILVLLANHPEVMSKVEAELEGLGLLAGPGRPSPRELVWEDVSRLTYLAAVIKEGLRIMPPAGVVGFRQTHRDIKICGYDVPAGTIVNFSPYAMDNSERSYGADAEVFRPERWLEAGAGEEGGVKLKEPIAFSLGPRDCVGQSLARLELVVFLAKLLGAFRLSLAPGMGSPEEALAAITFRITFTMPEGLWMNATPRA
mmetsp:Transcript_30318/g.67212  ORF Transcript_30318/g.67212 Transcript_30318/m.67212 type:complete len:507 (+) Transcript_30318:261-1781(+)